MLKDKDDLEWVSEYERYRDLGKLRVFEEILTKKFDELRDRYKDYNLAPLTGMTPEIRYKIYKAMYEYEEKIKDELMELYS